MRVLRRWTVGKQPDEPHLNEDAIACAPSRGLFAISDGASESFDSRRWSRILVSRYARRPIIDGPALAQAIATYNKAHDRAALSWSKQASFDRGSFATLLGIQIDNHGAAILGIGDSLAVFADGDTVVSTFPYTDSEQFRANPLLLSTLADRNIDVLSNPPTTFWQFDGVAAPRIFCMTDAIGAWLLAAPVERMRSICALESRASFIKLVDTARADSSMRRDDTTLLVIG